jgi:hypothetical protein
MTSPKNAQKTAYVQLTFRGSAFSLFLISLLSVQDLPL